MSKIYINTDGGSRGNPGPAAIGIVFCDEQEKVIHSYKESIGTATNNEAEYTAIIRAIEILQKSKWAKENDIEGKIHCRLDSQLVVEQLNGNYKIKNKRLAKLLNQLKDLLAGIKQHITFDYIPRNRNKAADKLVNSALDQKVKK